MSDRLMLDFARSLDATDPLAAHRDLFFLPEGVIYLDGNSLGVMPKGADARLASTITSEWGVDLIRSWNKAGWMDLPHKIGGKIGTMIGAEPNSVVVADSTSVNIFKALSAALASKPGRRKIITERANFPTDNYIAEGIIKQMGGQHELVLIDDAKDIVAALDDDLAVLMLTHVNYRTGFKHDMVGLTKAVHEVGGLVLWDLAHSAGAVPVDLAAANVDFAVGCGYKYLNGGPGAPAFIYAAPRHQGGFQQPLSGWFAHAAPFAFDPSYEPACDISQYLCGTPPVLSMVALDHSMDIWTAVDMQAVRAKSIALTDYFIDLVEARCVPLSKGMKLITPRISAERGSQVSFTHPTAGYAMMSALIAEGVIGDFRAPDIMRFGFTPLYTSFEDVWRAVDIFADILTTGRWDKPEFHIRKKVT